jgi:hypothetical protein
LLDQYLAIIGEDEADNDGGARLAIAATFALQQALPAALSGDAASLADGISTYQPLC